MGSLRLLPVLMLLGQGHHPASAISRKLFVEVLEVRRLPAHAGSVVDDLRREFSRSIVERCQRNVSLPTATNRPPEK